MRIGAQYICMSEQTINNEVEQRIESCWNRVGPIAVRYAQEMGCPDIAGLEAAAADALWRAAEQYDPLSHGLFPAYASRRIRGAVQGAARAYHKSSLSSVSLDIMGAEGAEDSIPSLTVPDAFDQVSRGELLQCLYDEIAKLPERRRIALILRYGLVDGVEHIYSQIGARFERNEQTRRVCVGWLTYPPSLGCTLGVLRLVSIDRIQSS